ncbi:hypothetical protein H0H93_014449, partial [Arthromyces matolae]
MVLQPNFCKRMASNLENRPPSVNPKSISSRWNTPHVRRRVHADGISSKYVEEQAARRARKQKQPVRHLQFKMISIQPPDVEMEVAAPSASPSSTVPVMLPKELGRPEFCEPTNEALVAAEATFDEVPAAYVRDALEQMGLTSISALRSLTRVTPEPLSSDIIPAEVEVTLGPVEGFSPINPTHMLAVFGPRSPSTSSQPAPKRKVVLYPTHSAFLAAHCSRLPPFAPYDKAITDAAPVGTPFKIPVRSICLPNPATYPRLSTYIYTQKADFLLSSLMPTPPPSNLLTPASSKDEEPVAPLSSAERRKLISSYAYQIASTYTTQVILQHTTVVHGLWQNT